ncbi:hypothetical protein F8B97_27565 [Klebsiella pneumoniae]|nr:hypothetical protein [Klebsiella pneumoniae]
MLCHGTVCVVGKIRDLILQLSKSSIYSTKPSIVEAHHGRVQVESDVRSTRFILSVPRLEKMIPETQC